MVADESRLDAGSLLAYLQKVKAWLDQNPNEGIHQWENYANL